jgi:hypothetical protein
LRVTVSGVIACKTNRPFRADCCCTFRNFEELDFNYYSKPLPLVPSFVLFYLFLSGEVILLSFENQDRRRCLP